MSKVTQKDIDEVYWKLGSLEAEKKAIEEFIESDKDAFISFGYGSGVRVPSGAIPFKYIEEKKSEVKSQISEYKKFVKQLNGLFDNLPEPDKHEGE